MVFLLLAGLIFGVYWPVQKYDFIYYDDPQFVAENPHINAGLTWPGVVYAFTQPAVGNWHPLTVLSHMLDCQLFGQNPGAHHMVNVAIHTLNTILLFMVLRGMTGAFWRSAVVAAIFGLHPLRVESVAWIAERKDVLSGMFFLLTLWAYTKSRREPSARRSESRATPPERLKLPLSSTQRWFLLALLFFALGLMSKPMVVTLPFVLLLLDVWPLGRLASSSPRQPARLILEKIPFFALAAICSVITLRVQREAGAMRFFQDLTLTTRLINAAESCVRYLGKLFWPTKLAIVYPHPAHGYFLNEQWPAWELGAAVLLLLSITAFCVLRLKRQPYLAVGWFWFLGTLVPVLGLVQVGEQAMANRYTYIPLVGPVIALVWATAEFLSARFGARQDGQPARNFATCAGTAAAGVVVALVWVAHVQVGYWRNTVTLFDYAISVTPDNPSAHFALGVGLEKQGEISRAMVQYRVALKIDPNYTKASYNLGQLFSKAGDSLRAAEYFADALRSNPNDLPSRLNFAGCLQRLGRAREAIAQFEQALRQDPDNIQALNNLAWILAANPDPQLRNGPRAVELAERAGALSQNRVPVMIGTLAAAYAEAGRFSDAATAAERAAAVAGELGETEVAARNRELLQLYRAGKPFHEK